MTIFASLVGTEAIAAQVVAVQLSTFCFMFPLGVGVTMTSIIGNTLGTGKKELAIELGRLSFGIMVGLECCLSMCIYMFGNEFVNIFALDQLVRSVAYTMIPYLMVFTFMDGIQGIASGILRGVGRQNIGAWVNIILYYSVGLPVAYALCFYTSFQVRGLMIGIAFAVFLQTIVFCTLIFCYQDYVFQSIVQHHQEGDGGAVKCTSEQDGIELLGIRGKHTPTLSPDGMEYEEGHEIDLESGSLVTLKTPTMVTTVG